MLATKLKRCHPPNMNRGKKSTELQPLHLMDKFCTATNDFYNITRHFTDKF